MMFFRCVFLAAVFFLGVVGHLAHAADLAILLTDDKPSFLTVGEEVRDLAKGREVVVLNLRGDINLSGSVVESLRDSGATDVVAIGLLASRVARERLFGYHVVFCQVMNYEDFDLIAPWMKGVDALPSLADLFRVWKKLDPKVQRVGVVLSNNSLSLYRQSRAAAAAVGVDLVVMWAGNSREVVPMARDMLPDVQGLWLAPDSRILNVAVVRRLLGMASEGNVAVASFSQALLREGALLVATPSAREIARRALARLDAGKGLSELPGPPMQALAGGDIAVSRGAAARLGLMENMEKLGGQVDIR